MIRDWIKNRRTARVLALVAVALPLALVAFAQDIFVPFEALKASAAKRGDTRLGAMIAATTAPSALTQPFTEPVPGPIPGTTIQRDQSTGQIRRMLGQIDYSFAKSPLQAARLFLGRNAKLFGISSDLSDLTLVRNVESPGGYHFTYQQLLGGQQVFGGQISVNMDKNQQIVIVNNDLAFLLPGGTLGVGTVSSSDAVAAAVAAVGYKPATVPGSEQGVYVEKGISHPAWRVSYVSHVLPADWEVIVDSSTKAILSLRNRAAYVNGTGMVFNINPVLTSGNPGLTDNSNQDSALLTAQRIPVTVQGLDGSGYLTGQYANTIPTTSQPRAFEPSLNYDYTRSNGKFEEIMCYYWLDHTQRYIQSLGFTNVNNRSIGVNVDGIPDDNAFYSPSTKNVTFGTGGVDDGEDADVIHHEYGHAIQDNQVPGWGAVEEGGAMGEGFGDYWAATQSAGVGVMGNAWDVYLAEWDATFYNPGNPAFLRRMDSPKHYPENVDGEVHDDGEMWSATLWQIRGIVGQTRADRLVLQAHFYLSTTARFEDGCNAILQANQALYAGADQAAIRLVMINRGFIVALATPSNLTASINSGAIQLNWNDNSDNEDGFKVERMALGGSFVEIGTTGVNANSFVDKFGVPGTMYMYRVRAYSAANGNSRYSNSAIATMPFPTYSISGWIVSKGGLVQDTLAANSNGSFQYLQSVSPALFIPDYPAAAVYSTMNIAQTGTLTAVKVGVHINHTYIGDLVITLIHPDGTQVILHNRTGGGTDDIITSYPTPTAPNQSLTILNGKPANGNWQLKCQDFAGVDTGTLNHWYLQLTFDDNRTITVNTLATGEYSINNLLTGTYTVTPGPLSGINFSPANRTVTVGPSQYAQNFKPIFP